MSQNTIGCTFCGVSYLQAMTRARDREQLEEIATSSWTSLLRGVDENGKVFLIAESDDTSERYYPKFCPECGRRLSGN